MSSPPSATSSLWASASAYDAFMGRWSRLVAASSSTGWPRRPAPPGSTSAVAPACSARPYSTGAKPSRVTAVDPSEPFVEAAAARLAGRPVDTRVGDAMSLPLDDGAFDVTVAGLVLNFVPEPATGVGEMARVTRVGGNVAAYVWDYAEGMQMLRRFWDAAIEIDPRAADLDEGSLFSVTRPDVLRGVFEDARLGEVEVSGDRRPNPVRELRRPLVAVAGRPCAGARVRRLAGASAARGAA